MRRLLAAVATMLAASTAHADPQQGIAPDRRMIEPVEPVEHASSSTSYDRALLPVLRAAPGTSARFGTNVAFAFDLIAGARIGLTRGAEQWGPLPAVGWSYRGGNAEHAFTFGLGVGWGLRTDGRTYAWTPALVLVGRDKGIRNGLFFGGGENPFSLELAHQVVVREARAEHEIRFALGFDIALALGFIARANKW